MKTDLEHLEELERAATKGRAYSGGLGTIRIETKVGDIGNPVADGEYMSALRNAAPAMIQELKALRAEVEGLKAQLATAREALEEARHSIEHTYFCQNDSAETGCTCNALYAQNKIANALKKTTKGGGA